jgi:regulator of sigma E protease
MDILSKICEIGWSVLPFLVVLLVIVFVHEMGHFLIARYNGVKVTTFSIGYGPELCGFTDKKGTRWRISVLPVGGYVMMLGDADATSTKSNLDDVEQNDRDQALPSKSPLQRMMVAFGGPLFNLLFTILVIASLGIWKGIPDMLLKVQSVVEDSVAHKCGIQPGDIITGIGDASVSRLSEMTKALKEQAGTDSSVHFKRGEEENVMPVSLYDVAPDGKIKPLAMLGIRLAGEMTFEKIPAVKALPYAVGYCYSSVKSIIVGIVKKISGQKNGIKLGSVFSIGKELNRSIELGLFPFLSVMAMLSLSLAFFNMLPIPVLDGGNILLSAIELIIRRPLSAVVTNVVYTIGLGIVGLLMVSSLWNDLEQFDVFEKIVKSVKKIREMF